MVKQLHKPPTQFQMILGQAVTQYHPFDLFLIIIRVCHAVRELLIVPQNTSLP
jgi:hypothetical protein